MIIVMQPNAGKEQIKYVEEQIKTFGFQAHPIYGEFKTVIGAIGDKTGFDPQVFLNMPGVETVVPIMKPYKLVSRELKADNTVVDVNGVKIGGDKLVSIAGPCAVESEQQIMDIALAVQKAGADMLRGGAYKPRTSPYAFQGLGEDGLKLLAQAGQETGLRVVTEVVDPRDIELVASYADMLQIGARNMQNYRLLQEIGASKKPVILKRGISATIEEWLMAAEYILYNGNPNVVLCERGIRTYETATRNTLDLNAIPLLKELTHLPVIVDPSHATGLWRLVPSVSMGVIAAGADGLIIEVHNDPSHALSDGPQSILPERFGELMANLKALAAVVGRSI
ncbi:3-deoxy-7-phosphoheptulonate synthase [Mahella sp.]|uniref:3-deoxy-7-phosphoheptulonate synthase n=1 Tax=Mahella sp. TaxID=2798721 RepID=UPI0025C37F32|nr:3-deoxy-7-phosphoheptulonate synthase [Mahella sp.]MBZ4664804.1 3-deoxy-D-arabinoheptulosonate-7-phosphate synthase [Mahella sp.]